jgi:SAM-dependent methyltransferase
MSSTNRGGSSVRRERDFYATPAWATQAILRELPVGPVLDPCCGDGALLAEIKGRTFGIEIDPQRAEAARARGVRAVVTGDALTDRAGWVDAAAVVMNPPFSLAEEFVLAALVWAQPRRAAVAALLRLSFLETRRRVPLHREHPADVFVLARRPSFTGKGTDSCAYAWFVWGPGRGGRWRVLS